MYQVIVSQFRKTLGNLDGILAKAVAHAEARGFDPNAFCAERLAPDMFSLTRQVQIACDGAKGIAAALTGREAPKLADDEKTIAELRARIGKTIAFLDSLAPADFEKVSAKTVVKLPYPPGKAMHADAALVGRYVPNFFFHVTTAYAILRKSGVAIGKTDYLGDLPMFDA